MKNNILICSIFFLLFTTFPLSAEDATTNTANNNDISDNLDLGSVVSVFGESKDLEYIKKRSNSPKTHISNPGLNIDGKVDYLRIMEPSEKLIHRISIQDHLQTGELR